MENMTYINLSEDCVHQILWALIEMRGNVQSRLDEYDALTDEIEMLLDGNTAIIC
jgi:hypothetical protein